MNKPNMAQFFMESITNHHMLLINDLDKMIRILATNEQDKKKEIAESILKTLNYISEMIPSQHIPSWTKALRPSIKHFLSDRESFAPNLNVSLMENIPVVKGYQWIHMLEDNDEIFDFDAIYEKYRKESNLSELFDKIIDLLEKINQSDEVDSKSLIKALEKLIKTLKKSKNGSLLSIESAWEFLKIFLHNYVIKELENIPAIGTLLVALIEATNEMQEEIGLVHQKLYDETRKSFDEEIKALPRGSNTSETYNKDARLLIPSHLNKIDMKG